MFSVFAGAFVHRNTAFREDGTVPGFTKPDHRRDQAVQDAFGSVFAMSLQSPSDNILQTFALGPQWPTLDPFLFCAHHLDDYPAGDGALAPDASLGGREIGSDFAGIDGWNMYHGDTVPGFPQHPHRGFETITYVRTGQCDHTDSLGAAARFGQGDTQWVTSGKGIVHAEMFPLLHDDQPNPLELFQIWLNLPAANKMVDPYFTMHWADDTPKVVTADPSGRTTTTLVVAGQFGAAAGQTPPPDSWASQEGSEVSILHISAEANAISSLPAHEDVGIARTLYVFGGSPLTLDGVEITPGTGAVLKSTHEFTLEASTEGFEAMVLQGRPIGEPVAQYGPFVMNTEAEIRQAFDDYRATEFGGWPWPTNDPNHGNRGRFSEQPDGSGVEL